MIMSLDISIHKGYATMQFQVSIFIGIIQGLK